MDYVFWDRQSFGMDHLLKNCLADRQMKVRVNSAHDSAGKHDSFLF